MAIAEVRMRDVESGGQAQHRNDERNHPVQTRMPGGMGAGAENPPATRLYIFPFAIKHFCSLKIK